MISTRTRRVFWVLTFERDMSNPFRDGWVIEIQKIGRQSWKCWLVKNHRITEQKDLFIKNYFKLYIYRGLSMAWMSLKNYRLVMRNTVSLTLCRQVRLTIRNWRLGTMRKLLLLLSWFHCQLPFVGTFNITNCLKLNLWHNVNFLASVKKQTQCFINYSIYEVFYIFALVRIPQYIRRAFKRKKHDKNLL